MIVPARRAPATLVLLCLLSACQSNSDTRTQPAGVQSETSAKPTEPVETTFRPLPEQTPGNKTPSAAAVTAEHSDAAPEAATAVKSKKPPGKRSGRALKGQNQHYDRSNPAYAQLQKANQALAGFPADRTGRVDWVSALQSGLIKPRASVRGQGSMQVLDDDILMTNTRDMPWVLFPHAAHTQWLACRNCHDSIFEARKGATRMNMNDIFKGRYCGACHDRVAFSTFVCERCHSVPHADSPQAWW